MFRPPPSQDRKGTVLVWVTVSLVAILSVVALGTDGGRLLDGRRRAQSAADAAALAAAADLLANYGANQGLDPTGSARAAALTIAAANGCANDGSTSVVTVNIPPTSGEFEGKAGYAEVIVHSRVPSTFAVIFGDQHLDIQARAVARGLPGKSSGIGVLVLRPDGANTLDVDNGGFTVVSGSVVVNSIDQNAYHVHKNGFVSADAHRVTGGVSQAGIIVGPVTTGVKPTPDPLANVPVPNPADYPIRSTKQVVISGVPVTLQPGVYRGGIAYKGPGRLTLEPGVYILDDGGFKATGPGIIVGNGVMFYNTKFADPKGADRFEIQGDVAMTLTPPKSGPYAGICLFQARGSNADIIITGRNNKQISGVLYAANAKVEFKPEGNLGKDVLAGGVISYEFKVNGQQGRFKIEAGAADSGPASFGLVE